MRRILLYLTSEVMQKFTSFLSFFFFLIYIYIYDIHFYLNCLVTQPFKLTIKSYNMYVVYGRFLMCMEKLINLLQLNRTLNGFFFFCLFLRLYNLISFVELLKWYPQLHSFQNYSCLMTAFHVLFNYGILISKLCSLLTSTFIFWDHDMRFISGII